MRTVLLLLFAIFIVSTYSTAGGDIGNVVCPPRMIEWSETLTPTFALIFPEGEPNLGYAIGSILEKDLQKDYYRFVTLFGTILPLPITVRIYPDEEFYYCLNPLAPEIGETDYHAHLGVREIALIGYRLDLQGADWQAQLLNSLRYELAILFVEKVTDGHTPPILLIGIGAYAMDPEVAIGDRVPSGRAPPSATRSWRELWETPTISRGQASTLQAMSIVAYLVDVYGWSKFQKLLHTLPNEEGYRQALVKVYEVEFNDLERQWKLYYPVFIEGRWRANVFYEYDLSIFDQLLKKGAYSDAAEGLKETINFLENLGEMQKVNEAHSLLEIAYRGQEAGSLVRRSRQALQIKEYEQCIALANLAEEIYIELDDHRRISELNIYRNWAREVLDLRAELEVIQEKTSSGLDMEHLERSIDIGIRLLELGDEDGSSKVDQMLAQIEARSQANAQKRFLYGFLVSVALVIVRVAIIRKSPPLESRLL